MAIPSYLPQQATLKGCWLLDETSGNRTDQSAGSHTATDVNTVGSAGMPKRGGVAADFESASNEGFTMGAHADFSFLNSDYSICCWMYLESNGTVMSILQTHPSGVYESWAFQISATNYLQIYHGVNNAGGWTGTDNTTALSTATLYHAGVTFDWTADTTSTYKFYINGSVIYTGTDGRVIDDTWQSPRIGHQATGTNHFDGLMQRLYMWKGTVLTPTEMLGIYNSEKARGSKFLLNFI